MMPTSGTPAASGSGTPEGVLGEFWERLRLDLESYLMRKGLPLRLVYNPAVVSGITKDFLLLSLKWQRSAVPAIIPFLILMRGPLYRTAGSFDFNRHLAILAAILLYDLDKNLFDLDRLANATDKLGKPPGYTFDFKDFLPWIEKSLGLR